MRITFFSAVFIISVYSNCQQIAISSPHQPKIFAGVYNPIKIFVEGKKCSFINVQTDNGSFQKFGCGFTYIPAYPGVANIRISLAEKGEMRLIEKRILHVDSLPPPIANVAGIAGGAIPGNMFKVQQGVGAYPDPRLGFELNYRVESFHISIYRNDSCVYNFKNRGNIFLPEVRAAINDLQLNDVVLIFQIICYGADKKIQTASPLEFLIL